MIRRSLFFLLVLFLFASAPVQAQPADSLIAQGQRLLDAGSNAGNAGAVQRAQSFFLRAAEHEPRAALARYYAGLAGYRLLPLAEEDRRVSVLNDALDHLEAAIETDARMADAHALRSALLGWKAGLQWYKAPVLGPKANSAMERAKELAPENPRVVFLDAVGLYNKPGLFGGDKEKALEGFRRAARLAEAETVADPLAPRWGRADALAWAGKAHLDAGRPAEARAALREALRVNPDFGWVKNVLMPQLAQASGDARE